MKRRVEEIPGIKFANRALYVEKTGTMDMEAPKIAMALAHKMRTALVPSGSLMIARERIVVPNG